MGRLLIVVVVLFSHAVQAAEILVTTEGVPGYPALIRINGQFMNGMRGEDVSKFMEIAAVQYNGAVVYLDSAGGSITAAVEIGRAIRHRSFSTVVADNAIAYRPAARFGSPASSGSSVRERGSDSMPPETPRTAPSQRRATR